MQTKTLKAQLSVSEPDQGLVQAVFSVFNMVDSDGDVVLPSFFTDGQTVPMAAWGHDWGSLPPGKGIVRVTDQHAVFDGAFFMDTDSGVQHFRTVKNLADTQEWSFGFRVLESEPGQFGGKSVRFLKRGEIFEASPVLIGANRQTYTQALKAATEKYAGGFGGSEPPEGSYEALSEDLEEAFESQIGADGMAWVCVVATWVDHFITSVMQPSADEPTFYDVPYLMGPDGETPQLGTPTEVELETTFTPVKGIGMPYGLHATRVEQGVRELLDRSRAGSAARAKEGRAISTARRARMAAVSESLRTHAGEIDAMLDETAPPQKSAPEDDADAERAFAAFLAIEASLSGMAV